jgi:hypothetical protein
VPFVTSWLNLFTKLRQGRRRSSEPTTNRTAGNRIPVVRRPVDDLTSKRISRPPRPMIGAGDGSFWSFDGMRPSLRQRFFAGNAVLWLAAVAGALCVGWRLIPATQPSSVGVLRTALLICVGGVLGLFLAVFPGMFVLGPLMNVVARINGSPFQVGDEVMILCGKHSGRVARIYELWNQRGQVRLELGEADRNAVTDVYSETQVSRQRAVK